jgi:tricorn protease
MAFDFSKREAVEVASGIRGYSVSPDGTKLIYRTQAGLFITDAAARKAAPGEGKVDLSGMKLQKDPKLEWVDSFNETWRRYRDFFYVENMNGVDWPKMKELYSALLPFVSHRTDLTYIISEMVSELSAGHCYVGGGDQPTVSYAGLGLLGATFEATDSGYYKIKQIYAGENWNEDLRSPLTEPGIVAKEGEYIIAIDGVTLKTDTNPYKLLYGKADRTIELTLNDKPSAEGARKVTVKPIRDEQQLRYYDWVKHNREYVAEKTGGRVGYIHVPDMGVPGLNEFVKWFYAQTDKEGLICDFRYNGGGFVSELVLDRLSKTLKGMGNSRNFAPSTYPNTVFYGHMVGLTNQYAASDGDIVSFYWKEYKLGPLVGRRTWGGVVGIRGFPSLLDGGYAFVPEFGTYDLHSKWIMENHGVDPDVVLDNLPKDVIAGVDAQLDKAIELVLEAMAKEPRKRPPKPAEGPVR